MRPLNPLEELRIGQIVSPEDQSSDEFYIVESYSGDQVEFKKATIKGNAIHYAQVSMSRADFLSRKWLTPKV